MSEAAFASIAGTQEPIAKRQLYLQSLRRGAVAVLVLLLGLLNAGCEPGPQAGASGARTPGDSVSVMVDSVNYRHDRGMAYTVYDLAKTPPQAIGGAIVSMLATGGEKGCCLNLPRAWRPGLKVRVDWAESDRQATYPEQYSRELEVPRYDAPADLYVVFYAPHEVDVVVSPAEPGHPEWRGRIKATPWDQCVATFGRKPCFAALPKQFDTASDQGFCTYLRDENRPQAEELCSFALFECVRDFEDEAFCKNLLWGPRRK